MNSERFKRRVYVTGIVLALVGLALAVHIAQLHFSDKIIVSSGEKPDIRRGAIMDRNGYILALSLISWSCYANPQIVPDPGRTASLLAPYLKIPERRLVRLLSRDKRFIWLRRKMDHREVEAIKKLKIPGIEFIEEYKRSYPYGMLAANIIGFTGLDNNGMEGIEYRFNDILNGENRGRKRTAMVYGNDIVLTIDRYLQYLAEKELTETVQGLQAKQGVVVIMDVLTGEVLALAKRPGFDPNNYGSYSDFERRSFSVIDSYEPGSTMKIFSMISMMENRPILLDYKYQCKGSIEIAGETVKCTGVHGIQTYKQVIRNSCNVAVIQAAKGITKEQLYRTLKKFNFGEKVSDDLPGEAPGILRPVEDWSGLSKYSIAIGQEVSVNSLQISSAFASVATGVYHYPAVVKDILRYDGSYVRKFAPRTRGRVLAKKMAGRVLSYMKEKVSPAGGTPGRSRYYSVAGKTGTSQKFSMKKGVYLHKVVSSYVGLVPAESPRLVIYVAIDDPAGSVSGGRAAAPLFARIVDRAGPYWGVVPVGYRGAPPVQTVREEIYFNGTTLPDFTGLDVVDALEKSASVRRVKDIHLEVYGSGRVIKQSPLPGSDLKGVSVLKLYCGEERNGQ